MRSVARSSRRALVASRARRRALASTPDVDRRRASSKELDRRRASSELERSDALERLLGVVVVLGVR